MTTQWWWSMKLSDHILLNDKLTDLISKFLFEMSFFLNFLKPTPFLCKHERKQIKKCIQKRFSLFFFKGKLIRLFHKTIVTVVCFMVKFSRYIQSRDTVEIRCLWNQISIEIWYLWKSDIYENQIYMNIKHLWISEQIIKR